MKKQDSLKRVLGFIKCFILVVLLAIGFVQLGFAQSNDVVPTKVKSYLSRNYPKWKIKKFHKVEFQENKSVAKGDFNGDGKTDYTVVITKENRIYALVLLATKNSYKAYNLLAQTEEDGWMAGIGISEKGQEVFLRNEDGSTKSFQLKNDGVEIYDGEGMGRIFYWQTDKFLSGDRF